MKDTFVIAAGGTGGHSFPALAFCEELIRRGHAATLVTDQRSRFSAVPAGVTVERLYLAPLKGGKSWLFFGMSALWQTLLLWWRFGRERPRVIVGFGGYPSFPALFAGRLRGIPLLLHEQNAVLGRVNRLFKNLAAGLALTFQQTQRLTLQDYQKVYVIGTPVRPAFYTYADKAYTPPKEGEEIRLVILGGSQGARVTSEVVSRALIDLPLALRQQLRVIQQCRPEDLESVKTLYQEYGIVSELKSFFDNVPALFAQAHLVISRAGAATLAELAVMGRPAFLIPYQYAMEDHQTINANVFAAAGAAMSFREGEALRDSLASSLRDVVLNNAKLSAMAASMRSFSFMDAASKLVDVAERVSQH